MIKSSPGMPGYLQEMKELLNVLGTNSAHMSNQQRVRIFKKLTFQLTKLKEENEKQLVTIVSKYAELKTTADLLAQFIKLATEQGGEA